MGDAQAGERVNARFQILLALVLVAVGVLVANVVPPVAPRLPGEPEVADAIATGVWLCPHGGGEEWRTSLHLANPGASEVRARISTFDEEGRAASEERTVPAGGSIAVPIDAETRATSSMVEYFGGWIAAGWVTRAAGDQRGVAAEPCAAGTADTWYLPDASTVDEEDDEIVVMNPFEADAVFSLTLLTPGRAPVRTDAITNVFLEGRSSIAVKLGRTVLGEATVATVLEVAVGRVAAAMVGVTGTTGLRAVLGYPGMPSPGVVLPGGDDRGGSELVLMVPGSGTPALAATLLGQGEPQPVGLLADAQLPGGAARAFPVATAPASAIVPTAPGAPAARRAFGRGEDPASTVGALPGPAWVVLPSVAGGPYHPGIVVANPGETAATVVLRPLRPGAQPVTLVVPAQSAVAAPSAFAEANADVAILVLATGGTVVPAGASSSLGKDGRAAYATALGVPVPAAFLEAFLPG
ncbi:MAG: DUF5719 family protein [Actinomycetota bacterium]